MPLLSQLPNGVPRGTVSHDGTTQGLCSARDRNSGIMTQVEDPHPLYSMAQLNPAARLSLYQVHLYPRKAQESGHDRCSPFSWQECPSGL